MTEQPYFSHDYNTRNKRLIAFMLTEQKAQGYGVFWIIIEMLHESQDKMFPMDLPTYAAIATQSGTTIEYVQEFVTLCIKRYQIFFKKNGQFSTTRTLAHFVKMGDISEKRAYAGRKSAEARAMQKLADAKQKKDAETLKTLPASVEQKEIVDEQVLNKKEHVLPDVEQNPTQYNTIHNNTIQDIITPNGVVNSGELTEDEPQKEIYNLSKRGDKAYVCNFIKNNKPKEHLPYLDLWDLFAQENMRPRIAKFNDDRKRKLATRLNDESFDLLEVLRKARSSELILGGGWFTFDWIIANPTNYLKVLEGNYDNSNRANQQAAGELSPAAKRIKEMQLNKTNGNG